MSAPRLRLHVPCHRVPRSHRLSQTHRRRASRPPSDGPSGAWPSAARGLGSIPRGPSGPPDPSDAWRRRPPRRPRRRCGNSASTPPSPLDRLDAQTDGRLVGPVVRIETLGALAQPVTFLGHPGPAKNPIQQIPKPLSKTRRLARPEHAPEQRLVVDDNDRRRDDGAPGAPVAVHAASDDARAARAHARRLEAAAGGSFTRCQSNVRSGCVWSTLPASLRQARAGRRARVPATGRDTGHACGPAPALAGTRASRR